VALPGDSALLDHPGLRARLRKRPSKFDEGRGCFGNRGLVLLQTLEILTNNGELVTARMIGEPWQITMRVGSEHDEMFRGPVCFISAGVEFGEWHGAKTINDALQLDSQSTIHRSSLWAIG
jgi:hypothetical protein